MSAQPSITADESASALMLSKGQRSHVLFVLTNARDGHDRQFLQWYQGSYLQALANADRVLHARHYEQHDVDITRSRYPRLAYRYLGLLDLVLDGAEQAAGLIERIQRLHHQCEHTEPAATWLYYPVSEKAGRAPASAPSMLTLAFANSIPGREGEFREWYATRHIRHALNIAALVSGQCFQRTLFQLSGALEASFATTAVYEQEGTPESIIESFNSLPEGTLRFPMLDRGPGRFAEWSYRPL